MRFGAPYMMVWFWTVLALIIFYVLAGRAREKALRRFAGDNILPEIAASYDTGKRKLRNIMMVFAVLFLVTALVRPQWGFQWQEVKRRGIDILIALDTSNSMLAEDVLPSRLDRAKLGIKDLIKELKGDRMGLIVFSGTAFLQCPLTVDYDGFLLTLDDVDVDTIPVGGTSLSKAIYTAINSFEESQTKDQEKILIIITDGEDLEGGVEKAVERAKANGVTIFCVGIGTKEGELIPSFGKSGKFEFLKDAEGNVVKTKLDEERLQRIALETGGMYVRATGAEFGLDLIYKERLSKLQKQEFEARMEKRYHERFQIPLGIAIFLLFLEPLIGDRRRGASL